MAEPANVMEPSSMKMLLAKSKEEPVSAAIGLGKDGGAKLLLHKTKPAMAVGKDLEKESPGLKDLRFGVARVDTDEDPKLVRLVINREVSGLARRLRKTLKGTGYTKIIIGLADGRIVDQATDEDDEAAGDAGGAPAQAAPTAAAPIPPTAPAPPPADGKRLGLQLSGLMQQMRGILQAEPARKDQLMALAAAATEAVKSGDAARGASAVAALDGALGHPGATAGSPKPAAAPTGAVAFQKMRLLWDATRKHLQSQLTSLEAAIVDGSTDDADAADIATKVGKLHASLGTLDERLSEALDALYTQGGTDPAMKRTAKDIAMSYAAFAGSDPLLQAVDANPFLPLDAAKRLDAALTSMIGML